MKLKLGFLVVLLLVLGDLVLLWLLYADLGLPRARFWTPAASFQLQSVVVEGVRG